MPGELRGGGDRTVLYGYKYIKHPAAAELSVVRHDDASVLTCAVESAHYKVLVTGRGRELIEATLRVVNRSRQFLTLTLPAGTDLWGVYRDGVPVKAAAKDGQILLPIFQGGLSETFNLRVVAYREGPSWWPAGRRGVALPSLDVGTNQISLEVFMPRKFRSFAFGGDLEPGTLGGPMPVTGMLDGNEGGDAFDESSKMAGEKNEDGRWDGRDKDQTALDELFYRTQADMGQTANIPPEAMNAAYSGAMARGALSVKLDIPWEGSRLAFAGRIVDPGETPAIHFLYNRAVRSGWPLIVCFAAGILLGWIVAAILFARWTSHTPPLFSRARRIAVASAVVAAALHGLAGRGAFAVFLGAVAGAACLACLTALRAVRAREKRATKKIRSRPFRRRKEGRDETTLRGHHRGLPPRRPGGFRGNAADHRQRRNLDSVERLQGDFGKTSGAGTGGAGTARGLCHRPRAAFRPSRRRASGNRRRISRQRSQKRVGARAARQPRFSHRRNSR
ncbi:MAG: hypothetical protein M5R36_24310 [Deltaproteobacteria bacterium]|nr:hypothetical protein [Deltaproteobacteria bacterium]